MIKKFRKIEITGYTKRYEYNKICVLMQLNAKIISLFNDHW